mmetsp:Transcript_37898/g.90007  ORF Transcript_37898/g.90007 Transcript_37898/m.90007 type:complete len:256 (-) Transcript_37898:484-1251(-)
MMETRSTPRSCRRECPAPGMTLVALLCRSPPRRLASSADGSSRSSSPATTSTRCSTLLREGPSFRTARRIILSRQSSVAGGSCSARASACCTSAPTASLAAPAEARCCLNQCSAIRAGLPRAGPSASGNAVLSPGGSAPPEIASAGAAICIRRESPVCVSVVAGLTRTRRWHREGRSSATPRASRAPHESATRYTGRDAGLSERACSRNSPASCTSLSKEVRSEASIVIAYTSNAFPMRTNCDVAVRPWPSIPGK